MREEMQHEVNFNNIPYMRRFYLFLWRMKFRFLFVGLIYAGFSYWGNVVAMLAARIERSYKKYKKQWLYAKNPECMGYQSATDTLWEATHLSKANAKKLSE